MGTWVLELQRANVKIEYDEDLKVCFILENGVLSENGKINILLNAEEISKLEEFKKVCNLKVDLIKSN